MAQKLIAIGETIHASIAKVADVMRQLHSLGDEAFEKESQPLNAVKEIIESQANEQAAFIAVNMDAFGEDDMGVTVELMKKYVRLVRKFGKGVPVCIDSSNDDVLIAGLKEWYDTDEDVKSPLVNSIKVYNADLMMPLKKQYDYAFIGLLMAEAKQGKISAVHTVDDLYELAKELYDKAADFGFTKDQVYFDTMTFPLAIDMPMQPGQASYTYTAFESIKKIANDPQIGGTHFSLGISNCCRDLPGRKIGIARAYVQVAMEYGLDAGIVNVSHHLGESPADPELVELVRAFAKMDGDPNNMTDAMMLMGQFCASAKK